MPDKSKIARLPAELRTELDRRLIENGFGNLRELSDWLAGKGYEISHVAVWRHARSFEERVEQMRAAGESARALVEATGDDAGAMSTATLRMIQDRAWDLMVKEQIRGGLDAGDLSKLANAMARVARASTTVEEVRRRTLREAAEAVGKEARRRGVSDETAEALLDKITGRDAG